MQLTSENEVRQKFLTVNFMVMQFFEGAGFKIKV